MADIIDTVLAKKSLDDLVITKPVPTPAPAWTAEKVEQAIALLLASKGKNFVKIARSVGMRSTQIEDLWFKIQARISELLPDVEPEELTP